MTSPASGPRARTGASEPEMPLRLRPLLIALREAVFVLDASDRIVFWNPAAERLLDTPAAAALGTPFRDLDIASRIAGLRAAMDRARGQGSAVELHEGELSGREGGVRTIGIVIAPLAGPDGRPAGAAVALSDE